MGYKQQLPASWFAMYAPAGIPADVKKVLVPAIEKTIKNPELKSKIEKLEFIVDYKPPAEQLKIAQEEYVTAMAVAKKAGMLK